MGSSPEQRLLLQYLEPSPVVESADAARLRDHLAATLERLPVSDLALGWRLRPETIEMVLGVVPSEVAVWRWVPVLVDSGSGRAADRHVALGPDGLAPPPFEGMADFRFLCLDQGEVIDSALERAAALAQEVDADGVLLDRIRWHSPSQSPATELTCFCARSREVAMRDGLDVEAVAAELSAAPESLSGRRALVAALLGNERSEVLAQFMAWRTATVTRVVARLADGLRVAGFASALDVFTPALAPSVGQDLAALADKGRWSKSMTYFDAMGPASMPFELRGYAAWLEEAGETDAAGYISGLLGFRAPGLGTSGAQLEALGREAARLTTAVGMKRSIVGIDAVAIPGVCEVDDEDLAARVRAIRAEDLGLSPCWELLLMSQDRVGHIAEAWRR